MPEIGSSFDAARWNPRDGFRLAPAWNAAVAVLSDWEPHEWREVVNAMLTSSDIVDKTAESLLYTALSLGLLTYHGPTSGPYARRPHHHRRIRVSSAGRIFRPDLFEADDHADREVVQ